MIHLLGAGWMGEVYLAEHPRLPCRDALKVHRRPVDCSITVSLRTEIGEDAVAFEYMRSDLVRRHDDSLIAPTTATALVADRLRSRGAGEVNVAVGSVGCVGAHAERGRRGGAGGAVDFIVCLRRHESDQLSSPVSPLRLMSVVVYRAVGAG